MAVKTVACAVMAFSGGFSAQLRLGRQTLSWGSSHDPNFPPWTLCFQGTFFFCLILVWTRNVTFFNDRCLSSMLVRESSENACPDATRTTGCALKTGSSPPFVQECIFESNRKSGWTNIYFHWYFGFSLRSFSMNIHNFGFFLSFISFLFSFIHWNVKLQLHLSKKLWARSLKIKVKLKARHGKWNHCFFALCDQNSWHFCPLAFSL